VVFDPNPQLKNLDMGTVSIYKWVDQHGRAIRGALVKPPGYMADKRYPLVIQTHGVDLDEFYRVGYGDTANAGRAIAARNMVVLHVREPSGEWAETWEDGIENGLKIYLIAIDKLAAEGLIDPSKVGLSGYSHTGIFVSDSITLAPDRFAAAVIANTDPGTLLGNYMYVDEKPDASKEFAKVVAGPLPLGDGIQKWIEHAPSFSADKIRAPVLFSAADARHLLSMWELYILMREGKKPVELQFIRGGQHNIRKPLEVFAHQEIIVDWFDFWLNQHEDADPSKGEQYQRWRKLRAEHSSLQSPSTN
jgi:dipeptidyl aminopeptidase/acylaminoacyl peptidase